MELLILQFGRKNCIMIRLLLALGTLLLAFTSYSQTLTELQTFRGSDTPNGTGIVLTRFGHSMDIDGNTMVVSEPYNGGGLVYVFELINNQWTEVAKLTASDNALNDDFGLSVAIDGDVIVVGAPSKEAAVTLEGAVYIYEKPVSGWISSTETIKLVSPRAGAISSFGNSVDIKGDELLIGASNEDVGAVANPGRMYVYTRTTSSWTSATVEAELTSTSIGAGDKLGLSATFEDDYIVSTALTGSSAGTLHVYEKPVSGTWINATVEDQLLLSATRSFDDRLGGQLHASNDFIVTISADDINTPTVYEPRLHVFYRSTGTWSTETNVNEVVNYGLPSYFNVPGFNTTTQSEYAIESIGNILLIGNGSSSGPSNMSSSGSLLITRFGSQPSDFQTIVEINGTDFDNTGMFGGEIVVSGSKVLVSSNREDIGGVVRFFDFSYSNSATQNLCPGQSIVFGTQTITSSGVYNETFTSVEGLDSLVTLTVNISDLAISTSKTDNICFGESNGEINVGTTGGNSPYEYSIDGTNYGSSPSFSFLSAGNYTVYIRDADGCIVDDNVTITEPAQITLDQLNVTDCECFGEASGRIDVATLGGTGAIEFSLDGTNFSSSPLTGIAAGLYNITARDVNGCEEVIATGVMVGEPPATMTPSISGGNATTYGTSLANQMLVPNASDLEIEYFQVFDIVGGALYKSDGTTLISDGDFVAVAEGQAGVVFDPTTSGSGMFSIRPAGADRLPCVNLAASVMQSISIAEAPLTITILDETITYGSTPALTLDYTGFVNGEDESVFTTNPVITNSVTNTTLPGSYVSTVSGAVAPNYIITNYVDGTIVVNKAILQTIAADASMTYGDASLPTFSFNYMGFVNGEDESVLDAEPSSATTTATVDSDAGSYTIQVSQDGMDDNYDFTYVDGELIINKATLTATADDKVISEDEPLPVLTFTYAGFVNNEDASVIDTEPTTSITISDSSTPGLYEITITGGDDNNYTFNLVNGQLTINDVLSATDDLSEIAVFPNPTIHRLHFEQEVKKAEVLSVDGKMLIEGRDIQSLDLSSLPIGIYLVKFAIDSNSELRKVRVIKK